MYITLSDLLQFGILIIALIGLLYDIWQKNNRPSSRIRGYFQLIFREHRLSAAFCMIIVTCY